MISQLNFTKIKVRYSKPTYLHLDTHLLYWQTAAGPTFGLHGDRETPTDDDDKTSLALDRRHCGHLPSYSGGHVESHLAGRRQIGAWPAVGRIRGLHRRRRCYVTEW